jgi:cyclic dehypoxanthinyl futalosine synthase
VTQGQEIGQVALKFGANDLGSIMIEENVVSQAGTTFRMTVADMRRLISELGYEPHQRDNCAPLELIGLHSSAFIRAGEPTGLR